MKHICRKSAFDVKPTRISYNPIIMSKNLTAFFCLVILSFISVSSFSQTTQSSEQVFYVQSVDLNVDNYANLHNKLKSDGRFVISSACIPAHVMIIKVTSNELLSFGVPANFEIFRSLTSQVNIGAVQLLASFNNQLFEEQCKSARTGN